MLSEKPWKPEIVARLFLGVILCFSIGTILSGIIVPKNKSSDPISILRVIIAVLSFQGAMIMLLPLFLRAHNIRSRDAFGFANDWKRALLLGAAGVVVFFPIGLCLQNLVHLVMRHFNHEPQQQAMVKALGNFHDWRERGTMVILAVLIVPVAEETLFRGILYPLVKQHGYPRLAFIGVSIIFAAVHFNVESIPALFALALLLTWLYEHTNNLLTCIVTHSLFNGLNLALFYLFETKTAS